MLHASLPEPPGYTELCAQLQGEPNPEKFRILVNEINDLLRAFERNNGYQASSKSVSVRRPKVGRIVRLRRELPNDKLLK
jgi:hypothetical protein